MIALGIDPGLATTGWGVVDRSGSVLKMIDYGVISTAKEQSHANRLIDINTDLTALIKKFSPSVVAVEQLFFYKNVKTALKVGEARGVILYTIANLQVPLMELTPLQVKQSVTAYGKADKQQVQRMVSAILKLSKIPKPDDAADALALAITAAQVFSQQSLRMKG